MAGILPNGRSKYSGSSSRSTSSGTGTIKSGDFKVSGFKEAIALLNRLPKEMQNKVITDALREGTEVVYKAIIANAPRHKGKQSKASRMYGSILENIRMYKCKFNVPADWVIFRVSTGDAFWGNFIERGTRFIAAMPWFRPKADSCASRVKRVVADRMKSGFDEAVARLLREKR